MLCDRKLLLGIGIGMILAAILMTGFQYKDNMSDSRIEEKARGLGMHYEDECKVFLKGDE